MSLIIANLYLGPAIVSRDTSFFKAKKICKVLIAAKCLAQHFKELEYKQLNLADNPTANIAKYFVESIKFIHESLSADKAILVHCLGGISRSSSIVIAYIMFTLDMPFQKAFDFVKGQHSKANPNSGFVDQLKKFEKCVIAYREHQGEDYKGEPDFKLLNALVTEHIHEFSREKSSKSK